MKWEILNLNGIPGSARRMRWLGHVARKADRRRKQRVLVWKPERKKSLVRPRCIWENNINMDIQEVGWGHKLD
jgi:hypothetical protein